MTLKNKKIKALFLKAKKWYFFANISRYDCPIDSLFEKSTFPHHLMSYKQLEVSENEFQR